MNQDHNYQTVSLNQEDIDNLERIGDRALKPIGVNPSRPAVIRHLIRMYDLQQAGNATKLKEAQDAWREQS